MSLFGGVQTSTAGASASGRYDRIAFPGPQGEQKTLSRTEFEKLALVDRVRLLSGGQLRFFRGAEEVSPGAAMGR
jgi:hypothetical protein